LSTTVFLLCIVFYIAITFYIAIVDDLAPQVDLLSSIKMTPLTPIQHPFIRDLMVSIEVFGRLVVEPKTLGWEHCPEKFRNCFQKPWGSTYSTEMLSKWSLTNEVGHGGRGSLVVLLKRHWCFFVVARSN
jgi:hypothetical protein